MSYDVLDEEVVHQHDILGGTVMSRVPAGYTGPTQLEVTRRTSSVAVFPDYAQALSAARFAVGELGGYNQAVLTPSTLDKVTHENWDEWAFAF